MNINRRDKLFLLAGVIGALILIYGLSQSAAQMYYVAGSSLLLMTAINFRLIYFIALELILISGHGGILLGIGTVLQLALPILLCLQLLIFYFLSDQLKDFFLIIGVIGIAVVSIGFAYQNEWIFFIGSISVAIYSFYCVNKGEKATFIWAILNSIFALITLGKIILI